jgi:hypothetical protein
VYTHSVKFRTAPENPIIVPICFNTAGRSRGDSIILEYNFNSPQKNITKKFGICVSKYEDIEYSSVMGDPCEETVYYLDMFNFDLLLPDRYVSPGENVIFTLMVSSDLSMNIELDKVSGPRMEISETSLDMPGDYSIDVSITAPDDIGDHPFSIVAKDDSCDEAWCEKTVSGVLHVVEERPNVFSVDISPDNKNVIGIESVKYFLGIKNDGPSQNFNVMVETDSGLESDLQTLTVAVGEGSLKTVTFRVIPKERDHKLHSVKVTVENEDGVKKTAEATLTVDEALSDSERAEENDMITDEEADEFEELYNESGGLEKLDLDRDEEEPDEPEEPEGDSSLMWYMIIAAAAIIVVVVFYIYKKSQVTQDTESQYFGQTYQ